MHRPSAVCCLVGLNGAYDLLCAACIILLPDGCGLLADLHPGCFKVNRKDVNRMLAYWLLTYGAVRACVPVGGDVVRFLGAVSYFVEAGAFAWEDLVHGSTVRWKAVWVCLSSALLGGLLLNELAIFS